jgi:hypothetical protein
MSAWGIIIVVVLIIVTGACAYYATICYPLLCHQERNYDIMNSSTITPTHSREFEKCGGYSRPDTPKMHLDDVDNRKEMNMKF